MTALALQNIVTTKAAVHEYRDLRDVSQRLAEITHMIAGTEAEIRRIASELALYKLDNAQRGIEATVDLAPIVARLDLIEATPQPAAPVAQPSVNLATVMDGLRLLADEVASLKPVSERVARIEAVMHGLTDIVKA